MLPFRKYIFIALLGFLFLPFLQNTIHFVRLKPLSGAYKATGDTVFTHRGWFSGKYQEHQEKFLKDSFGLRSFFIRIHNQIDFSLFHKPNAGDVIIGKNGDFFISWYLGAYTGSDFQGSSRIKSNLYKLKYIQDRLSELHKTLLVVFAPSKDLFAPEDIPDNFLKSDSTNYVIYANLIKNSGINYIDFNPYFIAEKSKTPYLLFPKYGMHWSCYGACIAGDSIMSKLEKLRNTKMVHTQFEQKIPVGKGIGNEMELENELNLLFPLKSEYLGHPQFKAMPPLIKKNPPTMLVGDSFFWGMAIYYNLWANFSSFTFCDYYRTIYRAGYSTTTNVADFNLKAEIEKDSIFIIEAPEPNLSNLGCGFIDSAYALLTHDTTNFKAMYKKPSMQKNIK